MPEPQKSKRDTVTAKRARPIRAALQSLIRERVKTREETQRLADFLGQSVASVQSMLYQGEGGMDSWISALIFCYQLEPEKITKFLAEYKDALRRPHPARDSDKLWFGLDQFMTEDEKYYWASLIKASVRIQRDLSKRKKLTK